MTAPEYVCSNCGSDRVTVDAGRPSLDDRFAIGFCISERERYMARKKGDDSVRPDQRVKLVRSDLYDGVVKARAVEKERKRRAEIATAIVDPKSRIKLTPEKAAEGRKLIAELYGR